MEIGIRAKYYRDAWFKAFGWVDDPEVE